MKLASLRLSMIVTFSLVSALPALAQSESTGSEAPPSSIEVPVAPIPEPMLAPTPAAPTQELIYSPEASTAEPCGSHNVSQGVEGYVIGDLPNVPYVVVVPGSGDQLLSSVRQCVTDAYQTEGSRGRYIRAGAFTDRHSAEQLSRYLRSLDLDARVIYSP